MKKLSIIALLSVISCGVQNSSQNENPFVGTWSSDFDGCTETYEFKKDLTRTYVSNEEKGIAKYQFTKVAENKYKVVDEITKTNGGTDCFGNEGVEVGHKATIYIKFNKERTELVMCSDSNFESCIQPFYKK